MISLTSKKKIPIMSRIFRRERNLISKVSYLKKFPEFQDSRGCLSFFENGKHLPFNIQSISLIDNLDENSIFSHYQYSKTSDIAVIPLRVKIYVFTKNKENLTFLLSEPNDGLIIPKLNQFCIKTCSENPVILLVSSEPYSNATLTLLKS